MKTKKIKKSQSENEERLIIDPPYTVVGNTPVPKSISLLMKVGGLKKMLKDLADEDSFRIEVFAGEPTEYSFILQAPKKGGAR